MKNLPKHIKFLIGIIVFAILFNVAKDTYTSTTGLYNETKKLSLSYTSIVQEQVSNYDGYYNTYINQQANANINKEIFILVTDIIMSNRRDGQNVAWKWIQENQQIPYEEFTIFYKQLSAFITERYADNMRIEREKQNIVQQHNLLLVTYPNNIINRFLNINQLVYKPGYISNFTKQRFK